MNIVFEGHRLTDVWGGIERLVVHLSHYMALHGHTVWILVNDAQKRKAKALLPPGVKLYWYENDGSQSGITSLRKAILTCRPDVCVSFSSGILHAFWAAALRDSGIPWVYSEHTSPQRIIETWHKEERLASMAAADAIHLLLPSYRNTLPQELQSRVWIIGNPVTLPFPQNNSCSTTHPTTHKLLFLGRLEECSKRLSWLLEAFAMLSDKFPDWELHIWGDGEDRSMLEKHSRSLKQYGRIRFFGHTDTPEQQFADADIFCIPSRFEGLPVALIEAMAYGLPAIGFQNCPGVNEVIQNEKTGLLVKDETPNALANGLDLLMKNAALRNTFSRNARKEANKYHKDLIGEQWHCLLQNVSQYKGKTRLMKIFKEPIPQAARLFAILQSENMLFPDAQQALCILNSHSWKSTAFLRRIITCMQKSKN